MSVSAVGGCWAARGGPNRRLRLKAERPAEHPGQRLRRDGGGGCSPWETRPAEMLAGNVGEAFEKKEGEPWGGDR